MAVIKRQGREKLAKIEQRKVPGGLELGPQIKQTALLASLIYTGQAQGEEKNIKRGAKIGPGASLLFPSFGLAFPHAWRMYFPLLFK